MNSDAVMMIDFVEENVKFDKKDDSIRWGLSFLIELSGDDVLFLYVLFGMAFLIFSSLFYLSCVKNFDEL